MLYNPLELTNPQCPEIRSLSNGQEGHARRIPSMSGAQNGRGSGDKMVTTCVYRKLSIPTLNHWPKLSSSTFGSKGDMTMLGRPRSRRLQNRVDPLTRHLEEPRSPGMDRERTARNGACTAPVKVGSANATPARAGRSVRRARLRTELRSTQSLELAFAGLGEQIIRHEPRFRAIRDLANVRRNSLR